MTYVNLHVFIQPIVHNKAVSKPNSMGFHWMTRSVGIVANIRVVEVCNALLVTAGMDKRIHRSDGRHLDPIQWSVHAVYGVEDGEGGKFKLKKANFGDERII